MLVMLLLTRIMTMVTTTRMMIVMVTVMVMMVIVAVMMMVMMMMMVVVVVLLMTEAIPHDGDGVFFISIIIRCNMRVNIVIKVMLGAVATATTVMVERRETCH